MPALPQTYMLLICFTHLLQGRLVVLSQQIYQIIIDCERL